MTGYRGGRPSTRNTRTERDGHAFALIALTGVVVIVGLVAVLLAGIYGQVKNLNDHLDTPSTEATR